MTAVYITKYLDKSLAATLIYLDQKLKYIRLAKLFTPTYVTETEDDMHPNQELKYNVVFDCIETTNSIIYSDQTGHFLCTSIKCNKYVIIVYFVDANANISQPIKGRSET